MCLFSCECAGVGLTERARNKPLQVHTSRATVSPSAPPGVERSPEELEQGQVDIYGPKSPYATKELTYTEAAFDKLVKLSEYNILNNKDKLLQALRLAVERKRQKSQCPP